LILLWLCNAGSGGLNWQQQQQQQGVMPSTRLIMNMNMAGPSGYATLSAPMFPLGHQEEMYLINAPHTGQSVSQSVSQSVRGYVLQRKAYQTPVG
jgi:hypothetical protein